MTLVTSITLTTIIQAIAARPHQRPTDVEVGQRVGCPRSARRNALVAHVADAGGAAPDGEFDPDSDEAWDAYNQMLARLRERE